MRPWYCAMTAPRLEKVAQQGLERLGMATLLPGYLVRDKHRHVLVKFLFPGYIFVSGPPTLWPRVRSAPGITGIMLYQPAGSEYKMPSSIASEEIDSLHSKALSFDEVKRDGGSRIQVKQPAKIIPPGCFVRITKGVFAGDCVQKALVEWSNQERASLLIDLFGRKIKAEFYLSDLERVDA